MNTSAEDPHLTRLVAAEKHLFIEASAGSGKTTRLVNLIAEIIVQKKATISEILCVTFTDKAAAELKARVYKRLSEMPDAAAQKAAEDFALNAIGTIHSFCLRSLAHEKTASLASPETEGKNDGELFEEAREWVYREIWTQIEPDTLAQLLENSDFGSGGRDRKFDKALRSRALWCFSMNALPLEPAEPAVSAIHDAPGFFNFTLGAIVRRMREIADSGNALSFSRMITLMAEASAQTDFATTIARRYRYALIDEFQDTDEIQWSIFKTLFLEKRLSHHSILIVVGDPKQAIYKFRGADVFVYLRARSELLALGAQTDELTQNYRSVPEIMNHLNAFFSQPACERVWQRAQIEFTPARTGDKVKSTNDDCSGVEVWHAPEYDAENTKIFCQQAARRIGAIKAQHTDWTVAVIAYKHKTLATMADALRDAGVEYAYYGEKPDVRRLDIEHLKVFVESFSHELSQGVAQANTTLFLHGHADPLHYYQQLAAMLRQGKIINFLQTIAQDLRPLHLILEHDPDPVQYHAWRTLFENLLARCGKDIVDLFTLRKAIENLKNKEAGEEASGDMLRSLAAVQLLTVQSSKGLDWNVVVLADGESDRRWKDFPFFHDASGRAVVPADLDAFDASQNRLLTSAEESQITQLNLLYVALTRPKHKLLVFSQPAQQASSPGPSAAFFFDWVQTAPSDIRIFSLRESAPPRDVPQQVTQKVTQHIAGAQPGLFDDLHTRQPLRMPDHKDVALRILEKKSFSSLAKAEFSFEEYPDDVLPRGAEIGQLLHTLLETCDFSSLHAQHTAESQAILNDARTALASSKLVKAERLNEAAERVLEIITNCARASLSLGSQEKKISLCELPPTNLWREMPFWSSADTHAILRTMAPHTVSRMMNGFMDLVFTPDNVHYYILDYKSNSLADVAPSELDQYIDAHYALQREIYGEALQRFLQKLYPNSGKRVSGCYFLFLRYLKSGESAGVQFREYDYV